MTGARLRLLVTVGIAYYVGARLGLALSLVGGIVTPLWPPTGIAVAAFVLRGRQVWPAIAIATVVVNVPNFAGEASLWAGVLPSLVTAVGNTTAPLVAAILLERLGFRRQLSRLRDAFAIVVVALASMLISATVGTAAVALTETIAPSEIAATWAVWWTGDAMGVLAVTPFLLSLPLFRELPQWSARQWVEAVAILIAVVVATTWAARSLHVLFLALPVVGYAAWRLQLRGAAPAALIASAIVTWSAANDIGPFAGRSLLDQMLTLHAFNASVALTSFVLAAIVTERKDTTRALREAAAELEARVEQRTAQLSTLNERLVAEIRERFEAQAQLSQEEARAAREHDIAETLQRSLLPDHLPDVPGMDVAARYVPATTDLQIGGDWYDVLQLPSGLVGLAIGDVAGHGIQAAAVMAQMRMALRVCAMQDASPAVVVHNVHRLVMQLPMPEMVTLLYAVLDPATRQLRFTSAGHPPALVLDAEGATYLSEALSPPIGVTPDPQYDEAVHQLRPGSTLVLYTDGLVERRGVSITDGLERLGQAARNAPDDGLDTLCDHLLTTLIERSHVADDVALVAVRLPRIADAPLLLTVPAEARMLAQARGSLRRWLREAGVAPEEENDILVACGEACANVVQHAYAEEPGPLEVEARLDEGQLLLWVRDRGEWRNSTGRGGGWGLQLMRALTDAVHVDRTPEGTVVHLRRRITGPVGGES